jgi:hypothetical protein
MRKIWYKLRNVASLPDVRLARKDISPAQKIDRNDR